MTVLWIRLHCKKVTVDNARNVVQNSPTQNSVIMMLKQLMSKRFCKGVGAVGFGQNVV